MTDNQVHSECRSEKSETSDSDYGSHGEEHHIENPQSITINRQGCQSNEENSTTCSSTFHEFGSVRNGDVKHSCLKDERGKEFILIGPVKPGKSKKILDNASKEIINSFQETVTDIDEEQLTEDQSVPRRDDRSNTAPSKSSQKENVRQRAYAISLPQGPTKQKEHKVSSVGSTNQLVLDNQVHSECSSEASDSDYGPINRQGCCQSNEGNSATCSSTFQEFGSVRNGNVKHSFLKDERGKEFILIGPVKPGKSKKILDNASKEIINSFQENATDIDQEQLTEDQSVPRSNTAPSKPSPKEYVQQRPYSFPPGNPIQEERNANQPEENNEEKH